MMTHAITDEQLMLYSMADGLSVEARNELKRQLDIDPGLRQRLSALTFDLQQLQSWPETPMPDAVSHRLQTSLQRLQSSSAERPQSKYWYGHGNGHRRWLWPMLAGATALATISLVNWQVRNLPIGNPPITDTSTGHSTHAAIEPRRKLPSSVSAHFAQTHDALSQTPELPLSANLIAEHRLFARLAEQQGNQALANTLRALEPMLIALEAQASEQSPKQLAALREQLQFELKILQTKWAQRASKSMPEQDA